MLTGLHVVIFAQDAERARAFFRDVLQWPFVDAHEGWLIFRTGPSEAGVHPVAPTAQPSPAGVAGPPDPAPEEVWLMCDDIEQTVVELEARGARFAGGIDDRGFGRTASLLVPGAGSIGLYEPRHPTAYDL
jgi:catechol 2,3-dioxygenase-like lactoylglutathione lyase family enzyme